MVKTALSDSRIGAELGLKTMDPVVHEFARRLGTVDFDSIEGHVRSLEFAADANDFLSLEEESAAGAVDEPGDTSEQPGLDSRELPGEVGPYVLVRLLGVGGFSRVFEAFHRERPDVKVAIKLFQHRWLDALERLEIEKLVLQQLRHPNLVRVVDSGETAEGLSYLVLSLVSGQRIDEYVRSRQLKPREVAAIFAQLADALAYAHEQDVVHRDLKPNNILVSADGFPVVADFGLAKRLRLPRGQSVTVSGALVGTLGYLAPEQVEGGRGEITRAVDIYGLGATLYAVLTGRPPTESENLLRGLQQLQQERPPAPRSLNPDVPWELQLICLKCLEKLPRERYGSMDELAADLRRFIGGQRVLARQPGLLVQLWRWMFANPAIASLVGGILLTVIIGLAVALLLWQRAEEQKRQAGSLLRSANSILKEGNRMAEDSLAQTPGSLEYRYRRLLQSHAFLSNLVNEFPDDFELQRELATTEFLVAKVGARRGMLAESLVRFARAEEEFRALADRQPDDLTLRFDVFHALMGQHHMLCIINGAEYFGEKLFAARELIEGILAIEPENTKYRDAHVCVLLLLPSFEEPDKPGNRLEMYLQAYAEAMKLRADLPEPCLEWRHAGLLASSIAGALHNLGRREEVLVWLDKALLLQREYLDRASADPLEKLDWITIRMSEIGESVELGELARARTAFAETVQWTKDCHEAYPDFADFQRCMNELEYLKLVYPELILGPGKMPARTED